MADAEQESNLVQVEISNLTPNLWLDELYTLTLTAGTASYALPARLVAFQAPAIRITSGGVSYDRIIWPYSTYEYQSIANKAQEGPPTAYWLSMTTTPEIFFWPVPDANSTYEFRVRMLRQVQDASLANGTNLDMPFRGLDMYVAKLAHRLARLYARDLEQQRKMDAQEAWNVFATTDKEQTPTYLNVSTNAYWQ